MYLKTFKNSKRYLAFALTFLMPIYPNFELLAAQNKEKIEAIENILNKGQAKKEIKRLNEDISYIDGILKEGSEKANDLSSKKLKEIKKKFGF